MKLIEYRNLYMLIICFYKLLTYTNVPVNKYIYHLEEKLTYHRILFKIIFY